jgi:hypothetical protein
MDCQLALHRRRNIPLEGVLIGSDIAAYILIGYLRRNMAETIRREHVPLPSKYSPRKAADSPLVELTYHDRDVELTGHWLALRQVLALSILCLSRMGHSIPALARRSASCFDIRRVGIAGMGVERFP